MMAILHTEFDNAKSFYNKATMEFLNDGKINLYSYNQLVLSIKDNEVNDNAKTYKRIFEAKHRL